jgi:hypothetical protein
LDKIDNLDSANKHILMLYIRAMRRFIGGLFNSKFRASARLNPKRFQHPHLPNKSRIAVKFHGFPQLTLSDVYFPPLEFFFSILTP